jgi:hypothetical protein
MTTRTAPFLAIPGQLAPTTPPNCVCCGIRLRSKLGHRDDNTREHSGQGRCTRCYGRLRYRRQHGTPETAPTTRWKSTTALAEYEHFRDTTTMTKQQIAERLGLKLTTLDRAIYRGRKMRAREEQREQEAAELLEAETEAHHINDDLNAYALRKAS